jgi:hypothetical protein
VRVAAKKGVNKMNNEERAAEQLLTVTMNKALVLAFISACDDHRNPFQGIMITTLACFIDIADKKIPQEFCKHEAYQTIKESLEETLNWLTEQGKINDK